ncbi:hypothetical protein C8Q73DRAFT_664803 [Cubamyces lactineus]|nr:hypothetical protein C8Q73DRAFT_664803 [Cubamyces lactineus]
MDELRKNAKDIRDQWHVDGVSDQEILYQWVRRPECLRDHLVAEPQRTVSSEEELMEPIKPILQLSMKIERERVRSFLSENPGPAPGNKIYPEFPQLPATVRTARQPYVFGWPITEEWLEIFSEIVGVCTVNDGIINGLTQLSLRADCCIFLTSAVHPDAPQWAERHLPPEIPRFQILQICHTLYWHMYCEERPYQTQYEWLKDLLPGEPGWFRSPFTFEDFDEVLEISRSSY